MSKILSFFFISTIVFGATLAGVSVDEAPDHALWDKLEQMSDEEIEALLAADGVDGAEISEALREGMVEGMPTRMPAQAVSAATVPLTQEAPVTLTSLIAQEQAKTVVDDEFVRHYLTLYSSPKSESIPQPKGGFEEAITKLTNFLDTKVRGKRIETVAMVAFIVYRQLSWLYQQYIKEELENSPLKKKGVEFTYTETMLGMLGFNSRALSYTDYALRLSFCTMRLYMDLSSWVQLFKQGQFFADPDGFLRLFKNHLIRAHSMFKYHTYYGMHMSLVKKVVLGLALPFTWAGLFSKTSPGAPFQNPVFRSAMAGFSHTLAQEAGFAVQQKFESRVPRTTQRKWFDRSGGLIRERLFLDMALWTSSYVNKRYVYDNPAIEPIPYFGRKAGKYAVRHVYLHVLIKIISAASRNGAIQGAGWIGNKCGWLLEKLGFCGENPVESSRRMLHKQCVAAQILDEGQPLEEVLVYPASVFPGAFVRAVRQVITKQKVGVVLKREPAFLAYLNAMHGIGLYDLLRQMSVNFMAQQQMAARITKIKAAVSPQEWHDILTKFLNELIIELFFDRQRIVCQMITEPILAWASKSLLHSLYESVLPEKGKKA